MIAVYTYECFAVFGFSDEYTKKSILRRQNVLMFLMHFTAFLVLYLQTEEKKMIGFYGMQVVLLLTIILLYTKIYPKVSRLVVNNMCMLLSIGFIMITRLSYSLAVKQFIIAAGAVAISLIVPIIIRKVKVLSEWRRFYAIAGVIMLAVVLIFGPVTGGALLSIQIGGFALQPSELVKIIFVFFTAASLPMKPGCLKGFVRPCPFVPVLCVCSGFRPAVLSAMVAPGNLSAKPWWPRCLLVMRTVYRVFCPTGARF